MLPAGRVRLVNVLIIIGNIFRFAYTPSHIRHKPGQQVVTFLLVCNLAMWMVNMLETNRASASFSQVSNIPEHLKINLFEMNGNYFKLLYLSFFFLVLIVTLCMWGPSLLTFSAVIFV